MGNDYHTIHLSRALQTTYRVSALIIGECWVVYYVCVCLAWRSLNPGKVMWPSGIIDTKAIGNCGKHYTRPGHFHPTLPPPRVA